MANATAKDRIIWQLRANVDIEASITRYCNAISDVNQVFPEHRCGHQMGIGKEQSSTAKIVLVVPVFWCSSRMQEGLAWGERITLRFQLVSPNSASLFSMFQVLKVQMFRFRPLLILSLLVWAHSMGEGQSLRSTGAPSGLGEVKHIVSQPVAAPREIPGSVSPQNTARAIAYAKAGYKLYFTRFGCSIAALLLLLRLQVAPRLRHWTESVARDRFLQALIFVPAFLAIFGALMLPVNVAGHWVQRQFGQSIQGWGSWFWDQAKGDVLAATAAVFVAWLVHTIIRRSSLHWWFWGWLGILPVMAYSSFVSPLLIDPLFHRFTPLTDSRPDLVQQIERVIARSGQHIPENRILLMDASRKVKALNAMMTGIGGSARVVVWDTSVARMTTPQILVVFGHELGHYVLRHIVQDLLASMALMLFVAWSCFHGTRWALRRFGRTWGIGGVDDWASLPVFLLVLFLLGFATGPAQNAFDRHLEHQADQYGLEVVHGIVPNPSEAAVEALKILAEADLAEPSPSSFAKVWFYSHPPLDERIRFAQDYNPWAPGRSAQFVK
jgi:Zn-dependent protease with chaperone function